MPNKKIMLKTLFISTPLFGQFLRNSGQFDTLSDIFAVYYQHPVIVRYKDMDYNNVIK